MILVAFGFVNDMDYIQTGLPGETPLALLERTQRGMDLRESLLRTTGGAIVVEPGKSDWVRIEFEQQHNKMRLVKKEDNEKLFVRNTDGERKELQQLHASTARKTLGVTQCVTGEESSELEYLLEKINTWSNNIWTSWLKHEEACCAVSATIGETLVTHYRQQLLHLCNAQKYPQHF